MLTIYGVYRSRATRPLWLMEELGLPYRHEPVIQAYRLPDAHAPYAPFNTRSAACLAIHSMGSIPSRDDDGFVLHESLAITLSLARKHGGDLAPGDFQEEASMIQWALFAASSIETPAQTIAMPPAVDAAAVDNAVTALARPFDVLEAHL